MPRYAELVYNGFWFSPERRALQAAIDETQKFCTGTVRVKLYKVCSSSFQAIHGAWPYRMAGRLQALCCLISSLHRYKVHDEGIWAGYTQLWRSQPSMTHVQ